MSDRRTADLVDLKTWFGYVDRIAETARAQHDCIVHGRPAGKRRDMPTVYSRIATDAVHLRATIRRAIGLEQDGGVG